MIDRLSFRHGCADPSSQSWRHWACTIEFPRKSCTSLMLCPCRASSSVQLEKGRKKQVSKWAPCPQYRLSSQDVTRVPTMYTLSNSIASPSPCPYLGHNAPTPYLHHSYLNLKGKRIATWGNGLYTKIWTAKGFYVGEVCDVSRSTDLDTKGTLKSVREGTLTTQRVGLTRRPFGV